VSFKLPNPYFDRSASFASPPSSPLRPYFWSDTLQITNVTPGKFPHRLCKVKYRIVSPYPARPKQKTFLCNGGIAKGYLRRSASEVLLGQWLPTIIPRCAGPAAAEVPDAVIFLFAVPNCHPKFLLSIKDPLPLGFFVRRPRLVFPSGLGSTPLSENQLNS